jgi:hypothetical protein
MSEKRRDILTPAPGETAEPKLHLQLSKQNVLVVDDRVLVPSDGPELLQEALVQDKDDIIRVLKERRLELQRSTSGRRGEIPLDPICVLALPGEPKDVLSVERAESLKQFIVSVTDEADIREGFKPFWEAVENSGFIPEIHIYGSKQTGWNPIFLMAKAPETQDKR